VETRILGTAGGVHNAASVLGAPALVWNGDIVVDAPVTELLLHVAQTHGYCLATARRGRGTGSLGLDETGHVVRLRGESFGREAHGADYVGVMALGADALGQLPEQGCLIGDGCLPALRRGERIGTRDISGDWFDIGTLSGYLKANLEWLRARGMDNFVHPSARVEDGVVLEGAVVGEGAHVTGPGVVRRAVVLPGAQLRAPAQDLIAFAQTRLDVIAEPRRDGRE
jgi:NDP-sugar pyrophosphorylase family protein